MKRLQFVSKVRLILSCLAMSVLVSWKPVLADWDHDGWFGVDTSNSPTMALLDDVGDSYRWSLFNNHSNNPTNSFGVGWFETAVQFHFPFVIEKDTPANSFYIADEVRLGINTNTPAEELHIVAPLRGSGFLFFGDPATVRLTGSGYIFAGTPTTSWDLNGYQQSFAIRETDSGNQVFKVEMGAPADTLVLQSDGGVSSDWSGTQSGGDGLKNLMTLTAENADASKSSDAGFAMKNVKANFQWNFRTAESAEGFMATKSGSGGPELQIANATDDYTQVSMQLGNGASCTSTGQWVSASSRDYKENIRDLSSNEVMSAFKQLKPVSYNFKKDANKEATIGFIAEDVPALVATDDRKGLSSLEIVALLTKVVQEQQTQIEAQQAAIQAQQEEIRQLVEKFRAPQVALPPSATLTGWQPLHLKQVPGSL